MATVNAEVALEARRRWTNIHWQDVLLVCAVVFAMALVGIATRPISSLASFWPANAVLLALGIRFPRLVTVPSFVAALIGYIAADLVTGSTGGIAVWLAMANLVGVCSGLVVALRASRDEQLLGNHQSIATFLRTLIVAAIGAATVGALIAPDTIDTTRLEGFGYWFSTEFANYMVVTPVVLLLPLSASAWKQVLPTTRAPSLRAVAPCLLLILSLVLAAEIGGTGALAIPVPFMIWCALAYGIWATVVVNFGIGLFFMFASTFGWLDIEQTQNEPWAVISVRLGLSLLTLGPLALAIVDRERSRALERLYEQANRDALTGLLNRRAFVSQSERLIESARANHQDLVVLMLDIDHFKRVNDTKGHRAGDHVLVAISDLLQTWLPDSALITRYGGEEFVALLAQDSADGCPQLAETLRRDIEKATFETDDFGIIHITVSGGLVISPSSDRLGYDALLDAADNALYQAKAQGRNRITTITAPTAAPNPL